MNYKYSKSNSTKNQISKRVLGNNLTIGLRIPDCVFTKIITQTQTPFITTSVNLSGQPSATKIEEIPIEILNQIDYLITTKKILLGNSSKIFDITKEQIQKLR